MAIIAAENVAVQAQGFGALPAIRQVGLLIGLALSVALGVTVALWSQTPNYSMLFANLSAKDMSTVTTTLDTSGIEYKIDPSGSGILVPAEQLHQARIKLASTGISQSGDFGFELLEKDQGLGSNSFLLKAKYNRALEGELAQSISQLNFVESARVHLAIPKQSAFARKANKPAASVVLNLYPGRVIDDAHTAGIINIVASSVPGLDESRVTVVDDKGRLLSTPGNQTDMMRSSTQFDYTRKLEESYVKRILDIISPIVGNDGVRAQVVADIDFTSSEETRENFIPDNKALRSEQLFEQNSSQQGPAGIPGALTNQPPDAGGVENNAQQASGNKSLRSLKNYEIDRSISHTRQSPAVLKRLSVAVVVDYHSVVDEEGAVTRTALSEQEVAYVTALVKEAVGLDEKRGDTINVVNTRFQHPAEVEPLPEVPLWEQPWVLDIARQGLGGLFVLFIAFGMIRPMLNNLSKQGAKVVSTQNTEALPDNSNTAGKIEQLADGGDRLTLTSQNAVGTPQLAGQQLLDVASSMVKEDPKRAAQVLNSWVEKDE